MKIVILILVVVDYCLGLPDCTDSWLDFRGYTYTVDPVTKEKVWSHCKFPNPTADLTRCGLPVSSGRGYICDPDGLLASSSTATVQINQQLIAIQQNTSTLCESSENQRQSYIVAVALVDRIRMADSRDATSCINDCNELQPTLNTTSRAPTDQEIDTMMANFANSLRSSWKLGACENDVIVFYSKEYNRVYTSVGAKATQYLSGSKLSSLHDTFLWYVNQGRIEEGLRLFVEEIRTNLRSLTPAHIILIINIVAVGLLVVFLVFFLHLSDVELNVWGREKQWFVMDVIVKLVTGVWVIQGLFYAISHILDKVSIWVAAICTIAAAGCIAIYLTEDKIFPGRYFNDKVNFTG
ncbi:uncharacterized protein LOC126825159 [Patella vulgata]|uniref:uncharacterized protein LOC126825159 n=1 Tax=Patella vulgata TaxID=6465 RepID=UPI00217F4619|nr:uncharacterized protein LOC126825159 [Patella vulgata]